MSATAGALRRSRRSVPRVLSQLGVSRLVWTVDGLLLLAAGAVLAGPVRGLGTYQAPLHLPWEAMVAAFAVTEWWRIHLHFRRSSHSLSLSEIPLVLGLVLVSPGGLVVARMLGTVIGLGVLRRQAPIKLAFNVGLFGLEAGLSSLLVHALVPLSTPVGWSAWCSMLLTVTVVSIFGAFMVMVVITLAEGRPPLRQALASVLLSLGGALANACMALEALAIIERDSAELVLLLVPCTAMTFAYGGYASERQKHQRMNDLYRSRDLLLPSAGLQAGAPPLLAQLCSVFRTSMAELIVLPTDGGCDVTVITMRDGTCSTSSEVVGIDLLEELQLVTTPEPHCVVLEGTRRPAEVRSQRLQGLRDAMITPLRVEGRVLGLLLVADRLGDLHPFAPDDAHFFEALASHASVSLENWRLDDRLKHQAFHDPLTGLGNRTLFATRLAHALDRRPPEVMRTSVLFIDLDDFKMVNDSLGHEAGDAVLVQVGERIRGVLRSFDTAARIGGDEFAVLLEDAGGEAAAHVAERIVEVLADPVMVGGREVAMHGSIGVSTAVPGVDGVELLRQADVAMYRAKERGKASFELFDGTMQVALERRLELKTELERAVLRGELAVHYQPVLDLATGTLIGAEALVRWFHPERGAIAPDEFIDLAEETGLIVAVGRFVLEEACRESRTWADIRPDLPLTIHVNVSPREMRQRDFPGEVAAVLERAGLPASRLCLEITERLMVDGSEQTSAALNALRGLGIGLAIDDFGTGYSSLAALHTLPVSCVKIAKPFVDGVANTARLRALVQAIIVLGRTLGLQTIAEGVERADQRLELLALGCNAGQGYLFSRPLDAKAFLSLVGGSPQRVAG